MDIGPYEASDIRPGDPYELSDGYKIECMGTGQRGARSNGSGFMVLDSDPEAPPAGVDAGVSPVPTMLRAPDVAVVLGVPLGYAAVGVLKAVSAFEVDFSLPPRYVALTMLGAVLIAVVSALYPAHQAGRAGAAESVHYE